MNMPPSEIAAFDEAMTGAGVEHEMVTYPEAPHSFFDIKQQECWDAAHPAAVDRAEGEGRGRDRGVASGSRSGWDQLESRLFARSWGIVGFRWSKSRAVLGSVKLENRTGFGRVAYVPRLDLDVDASEIQDPLAPRNQVLWPVASHALARQDEQALAIGHDEDCDVGGFAGLAAIRRERDLLLTGGRIDHVVRKAAHLDSNRPRPPAIPSRHCPHGSSDSLTNPHIPAAALSADSVRRIVASIKRVVDEPDYGLAVCPGHRPSNCPSPRRQGISSPPSGPGRVTCNEEKLTWLVNRAGRWWLPRGSRVRTHRAGP